MPLEHGHSGLILSKKDYDKAYEDPNRHSVQIKRHRNFDELNMKLVYSGEEDPEPKDIPQF